MTLLSRLLQVHWGQKRHVAAEPNALIRRLCGDIS